ncbi:hypothetical protein DFH27DRAFT_248829 [Peziza echinospora]|nr:hypothetical protein DFH27DRAFT_248829 [Peziza echinospora]
MLVLTNSDVTALLASLTPTQVLSCLTTLAETLQSTSSGSPVVQPSRQVVTTPSGATTLLMPTFTLDSSSVKIVTLDTRPSPSPSSTASTALTGSLLIFTPSGTLDAVLNASEVTAFRTALASMIPYVLRFLPSLLPPQDTPDTSSNTSTGTPPPPPTASEILIFGAGMQAEWALKLLLLLTHHSTHPLPQKITLLNRTLPRAHSLAARTTQWLKTTFPDPSKHFPSITPDTFSSSNLPQLIQSSDAIFCCTPSHTPLFPASTLLTPPSSLLKTHFFSAVGSYTPSMQELDPALLLPNKGGITLVIADTVEGVNAEAGEVIRASTLLRQSGGELQVHELGTLLGRRGQRKWQEAVRTENVLYKSVGMGIMDLVIGRVLVGLAREEGGKVGVEVEGF